MTREQFKAAAQAMATRNGWTLDIVEDSSAIQAWFSEPHPLDKPGQPYGSNTAQAYMMAGQEPVGLDGDIEVGMCHLSIALELEVRYQTTRVAAGFLRLADFGHRQAWFLHRCPKELWDCAISWRTHWRRTHHQET